jgi:phosphopantothenoylcysteine synthetase/decarboxylase
MRYAIIGFGKNGHALAHAFARKGIGVSVASTHAAESLEADAASIGSGIRPTTLAEAARADIIFSAQCSRPEPRPLNLPMYDQAACVSQTNYLKLPRPVRYEPFLHSVPTHLPL